MQNKYKEKKKHHLILTNLIKGFIIGIGKIIPGVSGALLAISMGVYDKSVYYINNFKDNKKESIKYLLPLAEGVLLSIILFSKIISYLLNSYYSITMLFFIGLIIGTIPSIIKETNKKDYYLVLMSLIIFLFITFISIKGDYILKGNIIDIIVLFISGIFEAIGTVIPGVSSTALLMSIGIYKIIVTTIGNLTNINIILLNLKIIIPFITGTIIGMIIMVKIIDYLFKKYHQKMYSIILGLLGATVITLTFDTFKVNINSLELFVGIILMIVGVFISSIFDK